MKINELKKSRKKVQSVFDPIEDAREYLEFEKGQSITRMPNNTLQLFVPRKVERYHTKKEREDHILRDRAQYAYDDEGNMIQQYRDWINDVQESIIYENVPIIAGGWLPNQGSDKPVGALLWTSTAKQLPNGKWTSSWNKFIQGGNAGGEPGKIGYVYKVLPNTSVLELDSIQDAVRIYKTFATLGRPNIALDDPKNWERTSSFKQYGNEAEASIIRQDFPWQEIAKHFDCVHHWPMHGYSFGRDPFFGSYDVESTVWFKPNQLELLGQVQLQTFDDEKYDD